MKKILSLICVLILCIAVSLGVAGCNRGSGEKLSVYVPDGAPALSVAGINRTDAGKHFEVNVVKADTINSYVTGDNPQADVAVMPVNAAVKFLSDGQTYRMLGTVTHGNLFLLKKQTETDIASPAELSSLVGKTVGVINLANVPGLTFKTILRDNGVEFNELKDGAAVVTDKVNLKDVAATAATPSNADCQYFVVPEPAATTKVNATQGKLSVAGNLQTLYGGENGYPQAVAVAKVSVIEKYSTEISAFIESFAATKTWLMDENTTAQSIVDAVDGMTKGDLSHTFTADNLTKAVISNCGIRFESNAVGKAEVLAFMEKFNAVSNNAWGTPADEFFY
ncbi:MAG: hypothetical protein K2O44_01710 [Clostridia bacterium]|nr:hypothetical protein [Clostridia bacterium]